MEIHRSARRHGIRDADIRHAVDHAIVEVDLDADADPPKVLAIGPDRAGNLLEVIVLELADDRDGARDPRNAAPTSVPRPGPARGR